VYCIGQTTSTPSSQMTGDSTGNVSVCLSVCLHVFSVIFCARPECSGRPTTGRKVLHVTCLSGRGQVKVKCQGRVSACIIYVLVRQQIQKWMN